MMSKSEHRAYVGFKDGPRAVKYYNMATRKVLTSRNYRFLTPPDTDPPPEEIEVVPNLPREGESRGSALPSSTMKSVSSKRKQPEEDMLDSDSPQKTRG